MSLRDARLGLETTGEEAAAVASDVDKADGEDEEEEDEEEDGLADSGGDSGAAPRLPKEAVTKMDRLLRELFVFSLAILAYSAFLHEAPKVSKSPTPYPFFPENSVVKDWYKGDLMPALVTAEMSEVAFIMYYAPWDAESQAVRAEISLVANYFQKQVHFAAINCWQPGSECRNIYNKIFSWPILVALHVHAQSVVYRGPRTAPYMVRFLQYVMRPLERITSEEDLLQMRASHASVVVAFVDASPGSYHYGAFYSTALKFLERDPFRDVGFAVVTSKISGPLIKVYMWNETLVYPKDKEWKPSLIVAWLSQLQQVTVWLSPPGAKSQSLARYLQPGPALFLFTPRRPLYSFNMNYDILHLVGLEYHDCSNNPDIHQLRNAIERNVNENILRQAELERRCSIRSASAANASTVITCDFAGRWSNASKGTTKNGFCLESACGENSRQARFPRDGIVRPAGAEGAAKGKSSTMSDDVRSPENIRKTLMEKECLIARLANRFHPVKMVSDLSPESAHLVQGLSCRANMSLTLSALDSLQFHYFAEGLGIDVLGKSDKTAAVILDNVMETHYVMQGEFSVRNLRQFILNYTTGQLSRTLGSADIAKKHTHHYNALDACHEMGEREFCVQELTTDTFLPVTMQQNKDVVVFYHSSQCAFCSGISYVLLTVAKLLQSINSVVFTRFNGERHSLPWEYTMHHYPTILLFPARRKSDSRVFSEKLPVTVRNLISFLLANVEPRTKLRIMWILCNEAKSDLEFKVCVHTVRLEILAVIEHMQRQYRSAKARNGRGGELFGRIQSLKQLHALLGHTSRRTRAQVGRLFLRTLT